VSNPFSYFSRWRDRGERSRGQTMAEFMLVLPVLLLTIFAMIELARLLFAWVAVENAARFALRYVVTGDYNAAHYNVTDCANFYAEFGSTCTAGETAKMENAARVLSARDAGLAGGTGVQRDPNLNNPSADWIDPGYFKITICSQSATGYVDPNPDNFSSDWMAWCQPVDHAGAPGDRVWVTVSFNHPMLLPFISQWWPYLHLTGRRDGIVERFRVARVIGSGGIPTAPPTETFTPTPSDTPTPSNTPTDTPCKVPPVVTIVEPQDGQTYTELDQLPSQATAYDPDNADPVTCAGVGTDGEGIWQVEFYFYWNNGGSQIYQYGHTEGAVAYCGFGGDSPCTTLDLSSGYWPNGTVVSSGEHVLAVRALDDEGVYSNWEYVTFYISVPPTPTPTLTPTPTYTPTPSCSGVSFGSFYTDNYGRIRQYINNTTYPGLQVTGITVNWGPLNAASDYYGWSEYANFINWRNGSSYRVHDTNDWSSTTTAEKNFPKLVSEGVNANSIQVDWNGTFSGDFSNDPLYYGPGNFGFTVHFSDSACDLYSGASGGTLPTITPTPTASLTATARPPTNTPPPSNTPTITLTPSITPTRTPSLTPSRTPTASRTPTPSRTPTRTATRTATRTPTRSLTPTMSLTPSETATQTPRPTLHD
jgi:hypothetical protein